MDRIECVCVCVLRKETINHYWLINPESRGLQIEGAHRHTASLERHELYLFRYESIEENWIDESSTKQVENSLVVCSLLIVSVEPRGYLH